MSAAISTQLAKLIIPAQIRLARMVSGLEKAMALKRSDDPSVMAYKAADQDIFVQTLSFPFNSLSAARRSTGLMIDRLSPLPAKDILWDIIGPTGQDQDKHFYHLGIIKKRKLNAFRQDGAVTAYVMSFSGEIFQFTDAAGFQKLGRNIMRWLGLILISYAALMWMFSQWSGHLSQAAVNLNQHSRDISQNVNRQKLLSDQVKSELGLLHSFSERERTSAHIQYITAISKALGPDDWLARLDVSDQIIRLNGYAESPGNISQKISQSISGIDIRQGPSSADRATGLSRFSMTLTLPANADLQEGVP